MENKGRNRSRGLDDRAKFNDKSQSKGRSQFKEMRECFHCGKRGHIKRNCWHWNKEKTKEKDEKNDDEKNTAAIVFHENVVMLSLEEQKCEHVAKNDIKWIIDSATSHHVISTKKLFTTYKAGDFGVVKMGNSSYSKIVGIGDVCIKTNVGCTLILKDVRHVPNLRMNVLSTLSLDRAGYSNHFGNGRWKLCKGLLVIAGGRACCGMYKTHVRACKKKSNAVKVFEKTPQLRVDINSVAAKKVKFSLPKSDLNRK